MQLVVNIPEEFITHYLDDNFKNSFDRIKFDIDKFLKSDDIIVSGNYEVELVDMLKTAFLNSEVVDKGISTFNERNHYKIAFQAVDDKYHSHMLNCLKIFYGTDCNIQSVKDYLVSMFRCGFINCYDLGHIFFVFIITLYFSENELDDLLADLKKHLKKE